jgi:uncharacterized phage protein (TIGR01671 family)
MREIKFKGWHNNRKFMFLVDTLKFTYNGDLYDKDSCTYLQYTGLKDKNGKEIYEGDIIQWFYIPMGVLISTVTFEAGDATIRLSGNGMHRLFSYEGTEQVQVIGNIYENPELLGGSNEAD